MNNNTIIISLTTWKKRINTCYYTIKNILNVIHKNKYDMHVVLVLSKDEFQDINHIPGIIKCLVLLNKIEIIFDRGNIKAHKKLIPTLEKYPNNPILIFDDDRLYDKELIEGFINSHNMYPNDIIVGRVHYDIFANNNKIYTKPCDETLLNNTKEPNEIITNSKPASGLSGTLYPAHSFADKRFFDRKLIKELCLESDEDWQFMFNIIEDRQLRMCSVIKECKDNNGHTEYALHNMFGQGYYENEYYPKMMKVFPEFYEKLHERTIKYEKSIKENN